MVLDRRADDGAFWESKGVTGDTDVGHHGVGYGRPQQEEDEDEGDEGRCVGAPELVPEVGRHGVGFGGLQQEDDDYDGESSIFLASTGVSTPVQGAVGAMRSVCEFVEECTMPLCTGVETDESGINLGVLDGQDGDEDTLGDDDAHDERSVDYPERAPDPGAGWGGDDADDTEGEETNDDESCCSREFSAPSTHAPDDGEATLRSSTRSSPRRKRRR